MATRLIFPEPFHDIYEFVQIVKAGNYKMKIAELSKVIPVSCFAGLSAFRQDKGGMIGRGPAKYN